MTPTRVAVVGVGYLGRYHAQKYAALETAALVGVCDANERTGRAVAAELGCDFIADHGDLVGRVDAVSVAATTSAHYALTKFFLEQGIHVLVEKPITTTSREAAELTEIAEQNGLKLQVGHIERFNPALLAARRGLDRPSFIECHRLAPFTSRGADVNVVLDLMIHDLDVILSLVDAPPAAVSAVGIAALTSSVDVANARIEFDNGAIANVTASRASTKAERKFRVWQDQQYVSIDFGRGVVQKVKSRGAWPAGESPLEQESWNLDKGDALADEIRAFIEAVQTDGDCVVSGRDGLVALQLAELIIGDIDARRRRTGN
ncbi:MAG: Gfo/Idh/MocA family oxidoreductase [Gammaproteobacteria bacterium]|nr:Gfo/Idh/MocA family oxidoreductase [Gammaproteobacteria bacterium]